MIGFDLEGISMNRQPVWPADLMVFGGKYCEYRGQIVLWRDLSTIAARDSKVQTELDRYCLEMGRFERKRGNSLSPALQAAETAAWKRTRRST